MFRKCFYFFAALGLGISFFGCEKQRPSDAAAPAKNTNQPAAIDTNRQVFTVKGVIREIKSDFTEAKIKHEEVPGYMPAMTMDFAVKNTNELRGLQSNDVVSFQMVVTENDGWIEQVKKLNVAPPTETPSRQSVRVVRDVEELKVGDLVPEYHFTNQLGQAVKLSDFKGQALAVTFIFTSCPFPTFCPRMSQNFAETQKKLKEMSNAPTNWHLLEISFDPEKDTPQVMKTYAERYDYDPKHWSFVTGEITEITAISEQFGQMFWREGTLINHNLRTGVIDAAGRLQKILPANEWKPDELADEILKAATAN